jgi:tetratricopeptide (TPR) repeat protein
MNTNSTKAHYVAGALAFLLVLTASQLQAQTAGKNVPATVEGEVQDSQNNPVAGAAVSLEGADRKQTLKSTADSVGRFRFPGVPPATYTLHASLPGYLECKKGPFVVGDHETKSFVLQLKKSDSLKDAESNIPFSDEPSFMVSGVTDTTALGGHGSGPVIRNSNALSKETASLAHDVNPPASKSPAAPKAEVLAREAAIRARLSDEDNADLRVELAEIEEAEGRPLDAVADYQRAAELQQTEPHLFAWGAELLLHHAPEPAIEVFSKGYRMYPQSGRMLLGLGAAHYAQRSTDQAMQIFMEACDLNPEDPTPYLFLGKLQVTAQAVPTGWTDRMKRFVALHPDNAMAHYLYAVGFLKSGRREAHLQVAEAELNRAIQLDPHLGDAYLYLGILLNERGDFSGAAAALQKAVENTPVPEEAHYRLAQVYRRMGDTQKVRQEIAQYQKLLAQRDEVAERERHEIPQFVYTLRSQVPSGQPSATTPK